MAKVQKKTVKSSGQMIQSPFLIYWEKNNYILFGAGILCALIGFYLMSIKPWDSTASLVYSPIFLFVAFVVLFPASILYSNKNSKAEKKS